MSSTNPIEYDEADVPLVVAQTTCTEEEAIKYLNKHKGDLLGAIIDVNEYLGIIDQVQRKVYCTKQEAIDVLTINNFNVSHAIFTFNAQNIKG